MRKLLLTLLLSQFVLPLSAEESGQVVLPSAAIKGIEANPRVTFIVPWQRSRMKAFALLPSHSVLDELYQPLSSRQLEQDVELDGHTGLAQ